MATGTLDFIITINMLRQKRKKVYLILDQCFFSVWNMFDYKVGPPLTPQLSPEVSTRKPVLLRGRPYLQIQLPGKLGP